MDPDTQHAAQVAVENSGGWEWIGAGVGAALGALLVRLRAGISGRRDTDALIEAIRSEGQATRDTITRDGAATRHAIEEGFRQARTDMSLALMRRGE